MRIVSILITGLMVSGLAYAGDVSFEIDHNVVRHSSDSTKTGDADAVKTTTLESFPAGDTQIKVQWDKMNVYAFPNGTHGNNTPLRLGYDVMPALEVGLNIGSASEKVGDADPETQTAFGLYGLYSMPMLEAEFGFMSWSQKMGFDSDADGINDDSVEVKGTMIHLNVDYIHQIAGGFHYLPGLSYQMNTYKADGADDDTNDTSLQLNLVAFRFAF